MRTQLSPVRLALLYGHWNQVTILANEHNASGTCLDVGIESHNIMLLSVQNPAQAAATLIHAWRRGWLTPG